MRCPCFGVVRVQHSHATRNCLHPAAAPFGCARPSLAYRLAVVAAVGWMCVPQRRPPLQGVSGTGEPKRPSSRFQCVPAHPKSSVSCTNPEEKTTNNRPRASSRRPTLYNSIWLGKPCTPVGTVRIEIGAAAYGPRLHADTAGTAASQSPLSGAYTNK